MLELYRIHEYIPGLVEPGEGNQPLRSAWFKVQSRTEELEQVRTSWRTHYIDRKIDT